jgi:hypothetical protein
MPSSALDRPWLSLPISIIISKALLVHGLAQRLPTFYVAA